MTVVFRTDDVPATDRDAYWRDLIGARIGSIDITSGDDAHLPDRLVVGHAGALRVAELSASRPGGARRTARHVRAADLDLCKIDVLAGGRGIIEQDGRQADLRAGDLTLVDLSRPARWTMAPVRNVAVVFPRALLPIPPDDVAKLTAVPIRGDTGTGALVSSCTRQLVRHLDDLDDEGGVGLGAAVLDLLAVALTARLRDGAAVPWDTRQRALLRSVHTFVEERLGDPSLTPAGIAAAHYVSLRYLYKLFETQGHGVADWIRRRRIERCRRDLLDPAHRHLPVSAVAARWGLPNPAHFSRLFRATYGLPPAEYRDQAFDGVLRGDDVA